MVIMTVNLENDNSLTFSNHPDHPRMGFPPYYLKGVLL